MPEALTYSLTATDSVKVAIWLAAKVPGVTPLTTRTSSSRTVCVSWSAIGLVAPGASGPV